MKSLAAGVIGVAVAGAMALGVYNLATTGCPLGTCSSEAKSGSATSSVALDEGAMDSCCMGGASELTDVSLASDHCDMAAGCSADKMASCESDKVASNDPNANVMLVGALGAETCDMAEGCCKEDGCQPDGGCCKSMAADEKTDTNDNGG
ncbi:MAG: hypothetical protein R3B57_03885 [Phycisphaerales bacterium]